jgi:hypothetical protein
MIFIENSMAPLMKAGELFSLWSESSCFISRFVFPQNMLVHESLKIWEYSKFGVV